MQPYLVFGGTEIANGNRTVAYIRALGPALTTAVQRCACPALGSSFVSPEADPAPWYTASRPESANFLGFYLDDLTLAPPFQRSARALVTGGQALGRLTAKGGALQCSGSMFARTEAGMEYGVAWLSRMLSCQLGCGLDTACVLPACPDFGSPAYRRMVASGITQGPTIATIAGIPSNYERQVTFQIGSESGYLFADPVTLVDEALPATTAVCMMASTGDYGDATTRITVTAGGTGSVTGLAITAAPARPGDTCPSAFSPTVNLLIPTLPSGSVLVIDGMSRTIQVTQESVPDVVTGGLGVLGGATPLRWIDLGSCDNQCICVQAATVNGNSHLKVEQIDRFMGASII